MADNKTADLPEGTDKVIEGANTGAIATDRAARDDGGTVTIEDTALVTEKEIPAPRGDAERSVTGSGNPETGLVDRLRGGREKLASQAGDKARGLVTQGLERRQPRHRACRSRGGRLCRRPAAQERARQG